MNLVADRTRPDSLWLGLNSCCWLTQVKALRALDEVSLTASTDKYLTRIDLKWDFESDDYAPVASYRG